MSRKKARRMADNISIDRQIQHSASMREMKLRVSKIDQQQTIEIDKLRRRTTLLALVVVGGALAQIVQALL